MYVHIYVYTHMCMYVYTYMHVMYLSDFSSVSGIWTTF